MKMRLFLSSCFSMLALFCVSPASVAQTPGYLTGQMIVSFDPANGQILNSFPLEGDLGPTVVSKDGTKLYIPRYDRTTGALIVLSAADGSFLSRIPGLSQRPVQARLSPSGNYLYEMSVHNNTGKAWISVVDLQAGKVIRYIHTSPGYPFDLAVSPDGTQLFVSSHQTEFELPAGIADDRPEATSVPISSCPLSNGICVFDTTTFALKGYIPGVTGFLAISQDGKSLYFWSIETSSPTLGIVNTASQAVSAIPIPQGQFVGAVTVAPSGDQAVILALFGGVASAYLFNTGSNQITGSFPPPPVATPYSIGSDVAAFSSDGASLWTLGTCVGNCMALAGQSFPSGATIAQVPITQPSGVISVTF